jgi:hypothetical protein
VSRIAPLKHVWGLFLCLNTMGQCIQAFKRCVKLLIMREAELVAVASHRMNMRLLEVEQEEPDIRLTPKPVKNQPVDGVDIGHAQELKWGKSLVVRTRPAHSRTHTIVPIRLYCCHSSEFL